MEDIMDFHFGGELELIGYCPFAFHNGVRTIPSG